MCVYVFLYVKHSLSIILLMDHLDVSGKKYLKWCADEIKVHEHVMLEQIIIKIQKEEGNGELYLYFLKKAL